MSEVHRLSFERLPSMGASYLRALAGGKGSGLSDGQTIDRVEATIRTVQPNLQQIAAYRRVCGFIEAPQLPVTYPHVLAVPLHLAVITSGPFPLPTLGLVHVSNEIIAHRAIAADEAMRMHCWVEGHREARKGIEFDLVTEIDIDGERVWQGVTTCLSLTAKGKSQQRQARDPVPAGESGPFDRSVIWRVAEDMGRRYAGVAGDYNPIHMWAITSKLFGFKRAIVHGMWSLARALAEVDNDVPDPPVRVYVRFRKPVFLPSSVLFCSRSVGESTEFEVRSPDASKCHLSGAIAPFEAD